MKTQLAACLAGALLFAGAAVAQNDPHDPMKDTGTRATAPTGDTVFDQLDANQDGYLSKNEVMGDPGVAQNFAKIDKDGDGKISVDEWKARGHHDK